ncbi:hypothetical protein ACFCV3_39250 [Kribbella sp. NPDC056345]|uniref:hypothetical protein n=1 Tax=Kribbella sp. NPDC056345 TaxID=3345789 RepID=UPI0035D723FE
MQDAGEQDAAVARILAQHRTPAERLAALERSHAPELAYGLHPGSDEAAEIAGAASYLQVMKRNWRAELAGRDAGNPPQRAGWEAFQREMDAFVPEVERAQPVWFLQADGYQVTGTNQDELNAIAAARERPPRDDPQQQLGITYQRDTMYAMLPDGAISRHTGTFDSGTTADAAAGWIDHVVRVQAEADELRLRVTGVVDDGAGNLTMRGTVLEGPVGNRGLSVGATVELQKNESTGSLTIDGQDAGAWSASFETFGYHQGRTRVNEGAGMHVPGAGTPEARNRGPRLAVDDVLFERIRDLYTNVEDPERGYARTLGPTRTRLNFNEAGWDVNIPPYRRLGGDAMFTEAAHPEPAPYDANLPVPGTVDVNDPNWYYDVTNAMPDRFVGGRSSSSTLYMTAATMLVHEDRLALDEAQDLMAFAVADMVVSGEHSMPECMTPVVLAASSSQPWQETPLNISKATPSLTAWMHLVSPETRNEMRTEARAALQQVLENPAPDPKVVKGLTMVVKATNDHERNTSELTQAMTAGLNPTPAAVQRVTVAANPRFNAPAAVPRSVGDPDLHRRGE